MIRSPLFLAFALAIGTAGPQLSADAAAQTTRDVRATAEASMVLTGNIDVAADGAVSGLVLDQQASIAPAIAAFVDGTIRRWQFEPTLVDGKPVAKHAPLRVRLLGRPGADGSMVVNVIGPGHLIGEMGVLDGSPRSATCAAITDVAAAVLSRAALRRLLKADPAVGARLLLAISKRMADRLRETTRKLRTFAQMNKALQQELQVVMNNRTTRGGGTPDRD